MIVANFCVFTFTAILLNLAPDNDMLYVIGQWISRSARFVQWQERVTGIILIGLGIKVALGSRK